MPLPIAPVIGILADNLRLRGSVMPLSRRRLTGWASSLSLPRGGEQIIYTGHMYQMMPSLAALEAMLAVVAKTPLIRFMGLGRFMNRFINISRFMTWPAAADQAAYDRRLRTIGASLKEAGVSFGYLYEKEMYSGALIYDLGVEAAFRDHAKKVCARLMALGVKRVITVDPHTTEMLREVYPKVVPGFSLEVKSYAEVLAEKGWSRKNLGGRDIALHDSCVYARGLNLVEPARALLRQTGAALRAPAESGKLTHCCGGPVESLFPEKTAEVARVRIQQLAATGAATAAVMCPICLHNLSRAAQGQSVAVKDLADLLAE